MSRDLADADVAAITVLLSPERLSALTALTGSNRAAIELHQETLRLNCSLMTVIASVELALRNTVAEILGAFFGTPTWLTHPPAPFQWKKIENDNAQKALDSARKSEYAKLSQSQKGDLDANAFPKGRPDNTSHAKRARLRRTQIAVSHGKVIAETTFYFWKRLYSGDYEQTLWRPTLKKTFPNKKMKRPHVAEQLEIIYQTRNQLAHHEPVLHRRFRDTVSAIKFIGENMGSVAASTDTPLVKLIAGDLDLTVEQATQLHKRLDAFRGA